MSEPQLPLLDKPAASIQPPISQGPGHTLSQLVGEIRVTIRLVEQRADFAHTGFDWVMSRGEIIADHTGSGTACAI